MKLDGTQRGHFHNALLSAFPSWSELKKMVDFELDENLDKIAGNANLSDAAFDLIKWAEARGRIEELIRAAIKANPGSPELRMFASQIGLLKDISSSPTAVSSAPFMQQGQNPGSTQTTSSVKPIASPSSKSTASSITTYTDQFDVFISYSHKDLKWVRDWLVPRLRQAGVSVCIDYEWSRPGSLLIRNLEQATQVSRKLLPIFSLNYFNSSWSEFENVMFQTIDPSAYHQHIIPVIYQPLDIQTIPLRLRTIIPVDLTGSEENDIDFEFNRLVAAIRDLPMPTWDSQETSGAPPTSTVCYVVPLGAEITAREPPAHLAIPSGYRYLGKLDGLATEHLYRERDGHIALWFPAQSGISSVFLIDKYTITAQQVSMFLNEMMRQKLAYIDHPARYGVRCCVDNRGYMLVLDAQEQWQRRDIQSKSGSLWGVTYENGKWQPIAGGELLPATSISWWGAQLYSLWAHRQSIDLADQLIANLPTARQWELAAIFNPATKRQQLYPWNDLWDRHMLNYAGYWAGREIHGQASLEQWKANQPSMYTAIRPLAVSALRESRSPIGCYQLLGNVWEWSADAASEDVKRRVVKGGACNSPLEYCLPAHSPVWRADQASEYIGFRCAFTL